MEFETPEWLTKEYLENALENGKEYKVTVEDLKIDMPIAKGNNYVCVIYGAKVKYRTSNDLNKLYDLSLIIKSPKRGPMMDEMIKRGFLEREPRMYNELSPKLKSVFCIDDEQDNEHVLPRSFPSSEKNIVILEDLKTQGYKMADRLKRLDYDHCVVALKALAKFHAGSVLIHKKEPEFIEDIGTEMFFRESDNELSKNYMPAFFNSFCEEIKNYPELEKYSNWFKEMDDKFFDVLVEIIKPKENELNVLNHGDFWTTNMLFKYNDENIPINVKLIDLQVSRYTTPVIDIMYFIDSSVQEDVRKERFEDLIDVYLNELNSTLKKYDCSERLQKTDFDQSWLDCSGFRIMVILSILPICIAEIKAAEMMDFDNMKMEDFGSADTNPFKAYYKNEKYMKIVIKRLQELEKIGVITAK